MKSAALIFGLIAGLLGSAMLVLGNIEGSLAGITALGADHAVIGRLIAYLVPAIGWLGAGLVLGYPRFGSIVLLLSAAAWAAIALIAGHGTVLFAAAPFTFAVAGALVGLFARRSPRSVPQTPAPDAATDDRATAESVIAAASESSQPAPAPSRIVEATKPAPEPTPLEPARLIEAPRPAYAPTPVQLPRRALSRPGIARLASPADEVPDGSSVVELPGAIILPPFQDIVPDDEPPKDTAPPEPLIDTPAAPPEATLPDEAAPDDVATDDAAIDDAATDDEPAAAGIEAVEEIIVVPGPRPRRPGDWTLPTPVAESPPTPPRHIAERQAAIPARVEPVAPASLPAPDQRPRGVSTLDFAPASDFSVRQDGSRGQRAATVTPKSRFGRRPPVEEEPVFKPDAPEAARVTGKGVRTVVRLLIAFLFIIVLLGLAAAVYLDYRRGPNSILFGHHLHTAALQSDVPLRAAPTPPAPMKAAATPPAPTAMAASTPTPAASAPGRATPVTPVTPPTPGGNAPSSSPTASAAAAAPSPSPLAPPVAALAPSPAAPASPSTPTSVAAPVAAGGDSSMNIPKTFSDPVRYCAAIGTADAPDARYTGAAVPASIDDGLILPQSTPADQVHWRCAGGVTLACNDHHTDACATTPTVDYMLKYCALHPGATNLPAPNGSWSCDGTRPRIPENQSWPVDARGFFPGAWIRISPIS